MPQQSRGDLRAGQAPRRRASRLRHEPARIDRPDAAACPSAARSPNSRPTAGSTASRRSAQSHYLDGFPWPDGKFRFKPDWQNVPFRSPYKSGPVADMPALPDHWTSIEEADAEHPFRLATSPARGFLNSTFNETPTSLAQESAPDRDDPSATTRRRTASPTATRSCSAIRAGEVRLHARLFDGVRRGVLIAEIDLAERRLCRRLRHQHADRRRPDRALWRRGRCTTTKCGSSGRPDRLAQVFAILASTE